MKTPGRKDIMRIGFKVLVSLLLWAVPLWGAARREHTWAVAARGRSMPGSSASLKPWRRATRL